MLMETIKDTFTSIQGVQLAYRMRGMAALVAVAVCLPEVAEPVLVEAEAGVLANAIIESIKKGDFKGLLFAVSTLRIHLILRGLFPI